MQKVCLVTGANSGLGKEITVALASQGARIIMVCRDKNKGMQAQAAIKTMSGSESVDLFIADLSSQADIRALAKSITMNYPRIDVLINNAGLVLKQKNLSQDGIEMTLATNYLGPFLLTHLLLDTLKKCASARIINISSAAHQWGKIDLEDLQYTRRNYGPMQAYAQSKLLMNIATFELARRLAGTGITVNGVHPGAVKTNLGMTNANNWFLKMFVKILHCFFISPQKAAIFPVQLALSPAFQQDHGKYFAKGKAVRAAAVCYDPAFAKKVWERSVELVGLA